MNVQPNQPPNSQAAIPNRFPGDPGTQGSRDKVEGADAPGQSMGARDPTGVAAEQGIAPSTEKHAQPSPYQGQGKGQLAAELVEGAGGYEDIATRAEDKDDRYLVRKMERINDPDRNQAS